MIARVVVSHPSVIPHLRRLPVSTLPLTRAAVEGLESGLGGGHSIYVDPELATVPVREELGGHHRPTNTHEVSTPRPTFSPHLHTFIHGLLHMHKWLDLSS